LALILLAHLFLLIGDAREYQRGFLLVVPLDKVIGRPPLNPGLSIHCRAVIRLKAASQSGSWRELGTSNRAHSFLSEE
jgi:hypothetical protein